MSYYFLKILIVSSYDFFLLPLSTNVPWGLFLTIYCTYHQFKPYNEDKRKHHNSWTKQPTVTNKHTFLYVFDPRNLLKWFILRFKQILTLFQGKICLKLAENMQITTILLFVQEYVCVFFLHHMLLGP